MGGDIRYLHNFGSVFSASILQDRLSHLDNHHFTRVGGPYHFIIISHIIRIWSEI